MSTDEIYRKLVAKEGLFGKAFFGHKRSRAEARRLDHLWKRAQKLAEIEATKINLQEA